ncbi:MAG: c-type cytochrome [Paracoccaceae bacterium]|nr:c-type cytochrome [Paracoccaceae bacterium]
MYDTMTLTKAVAALCGSLLLFLLLGWGGEIIFGGGHGGHGEEQAYTIDTGASEAAPAAGAAEVPFADVYASADAGAGEGLFRQCQACHKLDGSDGTGPHLNGVVDRDIASVAGFAYSDGMAGLDGAWTPEALAGFLEDPKVYAPGTKMTYNGMRKVEDRANLIAYLAGSGG